MSSRRAPRNKKATDTTRDQLDLWSSAPEPATPPVPPPAPLAPPPRQEKSPQVASVTTRKIEQISQRSPKQGAQTAKAPVTVTVSHTHATSQPVGSPPA